MFDRRFLLVLGSITLAAGIVLAGLWLRLPGEAARSQAGSAPQQERQTVLVAARSLKERALLRLDDVTWKTIPSADAGTGAYVRGSVSSAELAGAVVRHDLKTGDVLHAEDFVKPNEPGFLSNVLGSGMRAIAIAVGPAEGAAGLIVPGDRVDVVLIQGFNEQDAPRARRSVGETVLTNLRVIAIDQTLIPEAKTRGTDARSGTIEARIAKTVTLEVSPSQAQVLMVAAQLGKIQLTLRNANDTAESEPPSGTTWGSDVSRALKQLTRDPDALPAADGNSALPGSSGRPGKSIEILHGIQIELRCFTATGVSTTDCKPAPSSSSTAPATADPALPTPGATRPDSQGSRPPQQTPTPQILR